MTTTPTASATPIDPRTGWVLLHNGDQEIYVWAVHAGGWHALGWTIGPAPAPAPEQPIEPEDPSQTGGLPPETEEQTAASSPEAPIEELPEEGEDSGDQSLPAIEPDADTEPVDFTAMTKAEIIEHCFREYGVILDASLTKSALISEAEALVSAAPLPDALMDDLMT
ncbi:hypothetical protein [Synechococcus sp. EJ6-Ellesmere]|uniref:hypothetical protein n=1 Tax=Synechococcus sp. EJ6-Ellesmere TaxID=2823734 RepID=UPI0020CCC738|nr:hypothetical protein [Synechococcus sp. EJ6-Ellesmere]MCP9825289.1 hypothetical protein [Synechococcus sp. EJ6-Ellesmere]